jgi:excisionase family DNA binding protein
MKKTQSAQGAKHCAPTNGALKVTGACEYLNLSKPTVHRLVKNGKLRACRQVRHLLFARSELDRFIRDGMS